MCADILQTSYEWYKSRPRKEYVIKSIHGWNRDYMIGDWKKYWYTVPISYSEFKSRYDKCTITHKDNFPDYFSNENIF